MLHEKLPITISKAQPILCDAGEPFVRFAGHAGLRLYLYAKGSTPQYCLVFADPAQNGQPFILEAVGPSDQTQQWTWNGASNTSTFTNIGAPGFCIDNNYNGTTGDPPPKVQLWQTLNNPNQDYVMALIPALATLR